MESSFAAKKFIGVCEYPIRTGPAWELQLNPSYSERNPMQWDVYVIMYLPIGWMIIMKIKNYENIIIVFSTTCVITITFNNSDNLPNGSMFKEYEASLPINELGMKTKREMIYCRPTTVTLKSLYNVPLVL